MANIHQQIERPKFNQIEFSHIDERIVDKVDYMNNQNHKFLLKYGCSQLEADQICNSAVKSVFDGRISQFIKSEEYGMD